MAKKKFYAVAAGRRVGIYETWNECESQVKGFKNARFKGFTSRADAEAFMSPGTEHSNNTAQRPEEKKKNVEKNANEPNAKRQRIQPCDTASSSSSSNISVHISFDGGSRGNPGVAGAGAEVITRYRKVAPDGKHHHDNSNNIPSIIGFGRRKKVQHRHYLNDTSTNNQAEYQGAICGLRQTLDDIVEFVDVHLLDRNSCHVNIVLQGDSKLVINQLKGTYQCKNAKLTPLYIQCKNLVAEMNKLSTVSIIYEHIYRDQNGVADGLANEAMDAKRTWFTTFDDDEDDDAEKANKTDDSSKNDGEPQIRWV